MALGADASQLRVRTGSGVGRDTGVDSVSARTLRQVAREGAPASSALRVAAAFPARGRRIRVHTSNPQTRAHPRTAKDTRPSCPRDRRKRTTDDTGPTRHGGSKPVHGRDERARGGQRSAWTARAIPRANRARRPARPPHSRQATAPRSPSTQRPKTPRRHPGQARDLLDGAVRRQTQRRCAELRQPPSLT